MAQRLSLNTACLAAALFCQFADVAQAAAPAPVEKRLRHMEDVEAIGKVLLEYGRSWIGGLGSYKGPAAIKAAMEKIFANAAGDIPKGSNFHVMSNFIIDVQGDRATASSMFVFYRMEKSVPMPAVAGRYEDVLVRENGAWKFLVRNARNP